MQLPCVHADEKEIAGYWEDVEGFETERLETVMMQVFRKKLWKQTVSKVIQVREIIQHCCCCGGGGGVDDVFWDLALGLSIHIILMYYAKYQFYLE